VGELLTNQTIAELYDAYGPRLYRYAALILGDRAAAEDAVQDTFVHVARAFRDKPGDTASFGYLATTVRNTCYSMLRANVRRGRFVEPIIEQASPQATEEERLMLEQALRALPVEQREVVYLKVFEGLTFQEIAGRCGISINTAASRYRYATQALRRMLGGDRKTC
jgi:RNA polymerase sigma-70 factor (ECF subfamily)